MASQLCRPSRTHARTHAQTDRRHMLNGACMKSTKISSEPSGGVCTNCSVPIAYTNVVYVFYVGSIKWFNCSKRPTCCQDNNVRAAAQDEVRTDE